MLSKILIYLTIGLVIAFTTYNLGFNQGFETAKHPIIKEQILKWCDENPEEAKNYCNYEEFAEGTGLRDVNNIVTGFR